MRTVSLALAAAVLAAPGMALARPLPAGDCSAIVDDGVASLPRPAPIAISAPLPSGSLARDKGRFDDAVVDVRFLIGEDGAVSSVQVLCARPDNAAFADAVAAKVATWRFMSAPAGKALTGVRVAYRIVVTEENQVQRLFLGID